MSEIFYFLLSIIFGDYVAKMSRKSTGGWIVVYAFWFMYPVIGCALWYMSTVGYALDWNVITDNLFFCLSSTVTTIVCMMIHESQKINDGDENWEAREKKIAIREINRKNRLYRQQQLEYQLQGRRQSPRRYIIKKKSDL